MTRKNPKFYRITYFQEVKEYLAKFVDLSKIDLLQMSGYIYFAVNEGLTFAKIGYSISPENRLIGINVDRHRYSIGKQKLQLWGFYPGEQKYDPSLPGLKLPILLTERGCHIAFARYFFKPDRCKVIGRKGGFFPGEVFKLEGELRDFLLGLPRLERE